MSVKANEVHFEKAIPGGTGSGRLNLDLAMLYNDREVAEKFRRDAGGRVCGDCKYCHLPPTGIGFCVHEKMANSHGTAIAILRKTAVACRYWTISGTP